MKNKSLNPEPELSRPLRVEKISANGVEEIILASDRERRALAERFDLIEVKNLESRLTVTPERAGLSYAVRGTLKADVVQRCVVTLEPLSATIEQAIKVSFAAPELLDAGQSERTLDEDDLEPIADGIIDLGELVAQHFGLALDPYPRKSGLPPVEAAFGRPETETRPFARLAALRDKVKE